MIVRGLAPQDCNITALPLCVARSVLHIIIKVKHSALRLTILPGNYSCCFGNTLYTASAAFCAPKAYFSADRFFVAKSLFAATLLLRSACMRVKNILMGFTTVLPQPAPCVFALRLLSALSSAAPPHGMTAFNSVASATSKRARCRRCNRRAHTPPGAPAFCIARPQWAAAGAAEYSHTPAVRLCRG